MLCIAYSKQINQEYTNYPTAINRST